MKHRLVMFSAAGDSTIAEWEQTDEAAVEIARGIFDQAKAEGFGAVAPVKREQPAGVSGAAGVEQALATAGAGARVVDRFSPELEEIYLLRPIAGG